jgi:hypothetical protein
VENVEVALLIRFLAAFKMNVRIFVNCMPGGQQWSFLSAESKLQRWKQVLSMKLADKPMTEK